MEGHILITGCSRGGIGHALALEFANRDFYVYAGVRDESLCEDLKEFPNIQILTLDVTDESQVSEALHSISCDTRGSLDYLVNNAGQIMTAPMLEGSMEDARRMFDVNFWGPLQMTREFSPLLSKAGGTVVNIGSVGALTNAPLLGFYGASKAALHQLGDTLSAELKRGNIAVLTVVTGAVESRGFSKRVSSDVQNDPVSQAYLEALEKRVSKGVATPTGDYARRVADDILKGRVGRIYRGRYARLAKLLQFPLDLCRACV